MDHVLLLTDFIFPFSMRFLCSQLKPTGQIDQKNMNLSSLTESILKYVRLLQVFEQQKQPFKSTCRCPRSFSRGVRFNTGTVYGKHRNKILRLKLLSA